MTATDDIPPEAIEDAARELQYGFELTGDDPGDIRPWGSEELTDADRNWWREQAKAALLRALPHLRGHWESERQRQLAALHRQEGDT